MGDDKVESPHQDLITRLQCCLVDSGVVHIGAVGRPAVLDDETIVVYEEPAVLA
jgi:hypothetical protein